MKSGLLDRTANSKSAGRRRFWSSDEKRRMVAESLGPGASVSKVAQRYGVNANLLFTWRRRDGGCRFQAPRRARGVRDGRPAANTVRPESEPRPPALSGVAEGGLRRVFCMATSEPLTGRAPERNQGERRNRCVGRSKYAATHSISRTYL
jgi:transposase-like protein